MTKASTRRARLAIAALVATAVIVSRFYAAALSGAWADVDMGPLVVRVDAEGSLRAEASRQFGPPPTLGMWEFKVSFMAPEGADVSEGDRILAFDDSQLQERLQKATAERESAVSEIEKKRKSTTLRQRDHALKLEEARGKLEKAALKLERPAQLVAQKERAELELDRRIALREVTHLETSARHLDEADSVELVILENQKAQASRRATELQAAIDRMTIRAPQDGTVIYVSNRRGEKTRVGDTVWMEEKILSIPDLSRMSAEGLVDEADAGRLELGQAVEFHLDTHPEVTFPGSIVSIGKTVQPRTPNSPLRVVRVKIGIPETDRTRMRPEMRFRGRIEVERHEDVLLAPLAAIRQTSSGPSVVRRTLLNQQEVRVTLGARNDQTVEIRSGLSPGDTVRIFRGDR